MSSNRSRPADVPLVELPADAGVGLGVWQNLHGCPSGAALAEHLRAAASAYCGTAGPTYLDQLARERANDPETLVTTFRAHREQFLRNNVPEGADGQVRSAAARFALIGVAGELATAYEITGWPENEAMRAASACFKRWLVVRGGKGAGEHIRAVQQVRAFIAAHGSSRFEHVDDNPPPQVGSKTGAPAGSTAPRITINRAGWKRQKHGRWEYMITADCWKHEVCRELNPTNAADALIEAGFLVRGSGERRTIPQRIGSHGPVRVYVVRGAILGGDDDGE